MLVLQLLHTSAYLSSEVIMFHSLPAIYTLQTWHIPSKSQEKAEVIIKPSNNNTSPVICLSSLNIWFVLFVNTVSGYEDT